MGGHHRRSVPIQRFEYCAPRSLSEALALFQDRGEGGRALGGGTDLVIQVKEGIKIAAPSYVVSLRRVPELRGIEFNEREGLRVGATTTMAEMAESPVILERYRALAEGADVVGSDQTKNMATVGGNVCNAAPSADTAPPLLVFDAVAVLANSNGGRELPIEELWLEPNHTVLEPGELLRELRLPAPQPSNTGSVYARHTPRKQMDIAVVGVAALLTLGRGDRIERARIALGAVAPTPIRARRAEAILEGDSAGTAAFAQAAEMASTEASPVSDQRGSAEFRRYLVQVMAERCLKEAAERARAA